MGGPEFPICQGICSITLVLCSYKVKNARIIFRKNFHESLTSFSVLRSKLQLSQKAHSSFLGNAGCEALFTSKETNQKTQ